jgi:hypothetical protein
MFTENANRIFVRSIEDYHKYDNVDQALSNPYEAGSLDALLYEKNWVDTIQWHLEDIIRDPEIDPVDALALKRRIDKSNQDRTDLVERIDTYFWNLFHEVSAKENAKINTESPAWAVDRLSILHIKIYHMQEQVDRTDVSAEQHEKCAQKLAVLLEQLEDMTSSISQLLEDYASGERVMKVYRQMKMYNDPTLNPVLYGQK